METVSLLLVAPSKNSATSHPPLPALPSAHSPTPDTPTCPPLPQEPPRVRQMLIMLKQCASPRLRLLPYLSFEAQYERASRAHALGLAMNWTMLYGTYDLHMPKTSPATHARAGHMRRHIRAAPRSGGRPQRTWRGQRRRGTPRVAGVHDGDAFNSACSCLYAFLCTRMCLVRVPACKLPIVLCCSRATTAFASPLYPQHAQLARRLVGPRPVPVRPLARAQKWTIIK
ncbi:hypothetical protein GGX14DRAFT_572020 [Mycena pura]|uniref:Uncharacterized protein n=1 Tax=Mycena pura TaxID=153505 RepID=A0AAD6V5X7_9AGAR|nr:hypothetical protein GGX14DRAFT_572020 [Mycena pura]